MPSRTSWLVFRFSVMRKDNLTAELPGVPARRGRPATRPQDEKSLKAAAAARKRAQRARLAESGLETVTLILPADLAEALRTYVARKTSDQEPVTQGQAVERILRDRLLRKR